MKKSVLILGCFVLLFFNLLTGCNKEKPVILFSAKPISKRTVSLEAPEKVFKKSEKINFVVLNPEPFMSELIRLQIVKINEKVNIYGYSIAQARDIEIDTSKQYFISDFYLHNKGRYILRVFSHDNLNKPVAESEFWVK